MGCDCERRGHPGGANAHSGRQLDDSWLIRCKCDGLRTRHARQKLDFCNHVRASFYFRRAQCEAFEYRRREECERRRCSALSVLGNLYRVARAVSNP